MTHPSILARLGSTHISTSTHLPTYPPTHPLWNPNYIIEISRVPLQSSIFVRAVKQQTTTMLAKSIGRLVFCFGPPWNRGLHSASVLGINF